MSRESIIARALVNWYSAAARDLPWRQTTDPYAIWISEVMLQQTQVRTVIPYWTRWMQALPDVRSLAAADEALVLKLWEGLGYYRRARNLHAAARHIAGKPDGAFPRDLEEILDLPGIGRYTAGAIASIAFNQPVPVLDGNVARVLTRLHRVSGDPRKPSVNRRLWLLAGRLVKAAAAAGRPRACAVLNQALMELGALVCTPRSPRCESCPVTRFCQARGAGVSEDYPEAAVRPAATARHFIVIVGHWRGRFCVRCRPRDAINGGLWEFPNVEVDSSDSDPGPIARQIYGAATASRDPAPLATVRHAITRYRVVQRAFHIDLRRRPRPEPESCRWCTPAELEALAFSSAHRRIRMALTTVLRGCDRDACGY